MAYNGDAMHYNGSDARQLTLQGYYGTFGVSWCGLWTCCLAYDVNTAFLGWEVSKGLKRKEKRHMKISSDLSLYSSLKPFWAESITVNECAVPFDLQSLWKESAKSDQSPRYIVTSYVTHPATFLRCRSMFSMGTVCIFACRLILTCWLLVKLMCLTNESVLSGCWDQERGCILQKEYS
jgi:hypothetical protein